MAVYYLKKSFQDSWCESRHRLKVGALIDCGTDHQDINAMCRAAAQQNEKYRLACCQCQCIVVDESEKPVF